MKGIIGCEKTQAVTMAFVDRGHDFESCDIQECTGPRPDLHEQDSIFHVLSRGARLAGLDFIGMHPPCTYLANSSLGWLVRKNPKEGFDWDEKIQRYVNRERWKEMEKAVTFFRSSLALARSVGKGYVENPVMHRYAMELIGVQPTQMIQPWQFGHGEQKKTCLWLVGLPKLKHSNVKTLFEEQTHVEGREQRIWKMPPGADRSNARSATFPGIAKAMAEQWG